MMVPAELVEKVPCSEATNKRWGISGIGYSRVPLEAYNRLILFLFHYVAMLFPDLQSDSLKVEKKMGQFDS